MRRIGTVLGAGALLCGPAFAAPPIDQGTNCQAIVDYLDKKDTPHAQEAFRAARQLIADFDAGAVAKGQSSLIAALGKDDADNIYILVVESCRDYPTQTLGQTASDAYDGLRDLRDHPPKR